MSFVHVTSTPHTAGFVGAPYPRATTTRSASVSTLDDALPDGSSLTS